MTEQSSDNWEETEQIIEAILNAPTDDLHELAALAGIEVDQALIDRIAMLENTNPKCPHCGGNAHRHGKTKAGRQRYRCTAPACRKRFTPGGVGHRQKSATPEQISQIKTLHGQGVAYRAIASRLGLSPSAVYRIITDNPYT